MTFTIILRNFYIIRAVIFSLKKKKTPSNQVLDLLQLYLENFFNHDKHCIQVLKNVS